MLRFAIELGHPNKEQTATERTFMKRKRKFFKSFVGIFIFIPLLFVLNANLAECADPANLMLKGHNALERGQYDEALKWFQKAAAENHPYGLYRVGYMYEKGLGVDKDPAKAVEYYEKAGKMNFDIAISQLAQLYERGDGGVPQNFEKARQLYQRAIELGSVYDKYSLGQMYEFGRGVEQNRKIAAQWYTEAAAAGIKEARQALNRLNSGNNASTPEKAQQKSVEQNGQASVRDRSGKPAEPGTGKPRTIGEIKGKVTMVKAKDIVINLIGNHGGLKPAVGDIVDVSFRVADDVIPVGTWKVREIKSLDTIEAEPVEIQGDPSPSYDAVIHVGGK